jgi:hypothetical protein
MREAGKGFRRRKAGAVFIEHYAIDGICAMVLSAGLRDREPT